MKIQLKRSNVLTNGAAKEPTADQMEYGELAVNYNETDPVIFIKDDSNNIIRLTNSIPINDGQINVEVVGNGGLLVTGDNATANQATDTTRTLSVDTAWLTNFINTSVVFPVSVTTDENPPASPEDGALWWDSTADVERLFVYVDEGDGNAQWYDASPQFPGLTEEEINAGYLSKVNDDTAAGNITFTDKIGIGSANTGTDALRVTGDSSITGMVTSNSIDTQTISAVTYNLEALPALQPVP